MKGAQWIFRGDDGAAYWICLSPLIPQRPQSALFVLLSFPLELFFLYCLASGSPLDSAHLSIFTASCSPTLCISAQVNPSIFGFYNAYTDSHQYIKWTLTSRCTNSTKSVPLPRDLPCHVLLRTPNRIPIVPDADDSARIGPDEPSVPDVVPKISTGAKGKGKRTSERP